MLGVEELLVLQANDVCKEFGGLLALLCDYLGRLERLLWDIGHA